LLLELLVEALGDAFDVERFPQPGGDLDDRGVSLRGDVGNCKRVGRRRE